jgi:ferric-dicitrate binding protein FerR (iron transport regulator)
MDTDDQVRGDDMSPDEQSPVPEWLESGDADAAERRIIAEAWHRAVGIPNTFSSQAGWDRIAARIEEKVTARDAIPISGSRSAGRDVMHGARQSRTWLRWAAGIVLLIGAALWSPVRDAYAPEPMFQSYATAAGQRATLTLADGSRALLGPESELRFPERLRRNSRDVELHGVAYFEVASDPDRPFRVHAQGVVTRVHGTRFVVRAYPGEELVDVGVAEGRVSVHAENLAETEALILTPGQGARVRADGSAQRVDRDGVDALLSWKDGRLTFRDTPARDVLRELQRWYDVEISVSVPGVGDRLLNVSFDHDKPIEAITLLAAILDLRMERSGREIVLVPVSPRNR